MWNDKREVCSVMGRVNNLVVGEVLKLWNKEKLVFVETIKMLIAGLPECPSLTQQQKQSNYYFIMAYGSTPYVGVTHSKCLH